MHNKKVHCPAPLSRLRTMQHHPQEAPGDPDLLTLKMRLLARQDFTGKK